VSRKDYRAAAEVIRDEVERAERCGNGRVEQLQLEAVARVARGLADLFKRDNARFDRQRFYAACGLDEQGRVR
jgi:hypothetical protein